MFFKSKLISTCTILSACRASFLASQTRKAKCVTKSSVARNVPAALWNNSNEAAPSANRTREAKAAKP